MPIGQFEDFADLKAHLRSEYKKKRKKAGDMNAITAAVAERIRPGWHKEATKARKENRNGE